ncbi:MAG: hypothetical protein WKG32_04590 [Gemmatimonadaceae bacterium]
MRSPGSGARVTVECMLRVASVVLSAWMLRRSLAPLLPPVPSEAASPATLDAALARWTESAGLESLHVVLDSAPDARGLAWLASLRRAGATVTWSAPAIPATAIAVEPVNEPGGGERLLVAAPSGSVVEVRDGAGLLDTLRIVAAGGSVATTALEAPAAARVASQWARTAPRDSLIVRRVLVVGRAGWEAKFAIAALEERGWLVDARLRVAPTVEVTQGAPVAALDTARYAAVVALDSSVGPLAGRIARYVRDGGGVVLAGSAARVPALAAIAAGAPGARVRAASVSLAGTEPRRALGYYPIASLRREAVLLERSDGRTAAAARREGAGRVVQVGYDESWRWRMLGGPSGPADHRAWWSALVGSAAYRAATPLAARSPGAAPLAELVDALGAESAAPAPAAPVTTSRGVPGWMLALLFLCLFAEWTSRRTRGAA